jgi:hypothetical protein
MDTVRKQHSQAIPAHILRHFRAQSKSGKTFRAYSISTGISPLTFYGWRKKYGKHFDVKVKQKLHGPTPPSEEVFATFPTHLFQHGTDDPLLDIQFSDNLKFRIYRGATAEWFVPFYKLFRDDKSIC